MSTFRRLVLFLRPFGGEVALSVLLSAGTVAAGIGLLGASAYLIAFAALRPSISLLEVAIVGVRFFGISRAVLRYLERLVTHSVNFRLLARLRAWFYRAVEPLAPARLEGYQSGDLLSRAVADIETLENFYVRAVSPPLAALLVTVGMGWFVGRYDALAGLILAAGLALAGVSASLLAYLFARSFSAKTAAALARLSAVLVDGIQGLADLQVYGQEERYFQAVSTASRQMEGARARQNRAGALGNALVVLLTGLTAWGVLAAAVPLVRSGRLDGVSLAVLVLLAIASFEAVAPLPQAAQTLEASLTSGQRLFELADTAPEVTPLDRPLPFPESPFLSIRNLSFSYRPDLPSALQQLDLDLSPGRRIALLGPSGAGKSTLASLLLRFWDSPPGTIFLAGQDLRSYDPQDVRRAIGLVPQSTFIFSATLRQNLLLAKPDAQPQELEVALKKSRLESLLARLPAGLDTFLGSQGEQLSGGERQRLALARAFLQNPPLLILDEPVSGLDAQTARDLMETLRVFTSAQGLLVITHDLVGLEWFDEIIVLSGGRVLERGSHAGLVKANGWYAAALRLRCQVLEDREL